MLFWKDYSDIALSLSEKQKLSDQKSISEKMREFRFDSIVGEYFNKTEPGIQLCKVEITDNDKHKVINKLENLKIFNKIKLRSGVEYPHGGGELAEMVWAGIIYRLLDVINSQFEIWSSSYTDVNPKGHRIVGSLLGNLRDFHHGFGP